MNRGFLLVITGPSGVGKGTVLSLVRERDKDVFFSVSATTRPMRPHESEGKNYFFVDRARFEAMIRDGELIEHTEYCGNFYGTPLAPVTQMLEEGRVVVLEIETDGAAQIKRRHPEAIMVFIVPPDFVELERRLKKRGTEDEDQIRNRLVRAMEEYKVAQTLDYIIENDKLESAADDLLAVIAAERCRTARKLHILQGGK